MMKDVTRDGMWENPTVFAMPNGEALPLTLPPRLASWNRADDPDQVRLKEYLDATEDLVRRRLDELRGPLALRLDVGLPETIPLLEARDLDNYLCPLVTRLPKHRRFLSVWATKRHADHSFIRIEQAVPTQWLPDLDGVHRVRTTASSERTAFKQQIDDQLTDAAVLPEGEIRLWLAFAVGPRRNWVNLWKPSIDALGRLLGRSKPNPWEPRDGRITELALHCQVDPALGNDVVITIVGNTIQPTIEP